MELYLHLASALCQLAWHSALLRRHWRDTGGLEEEGIFQVLCSVFHGTLLVWREHSCKASCSALCGPLETPPAGCHHSVNYFCSSAGTSSSKFLGQQNKKIFSWFHNEWIPLSCCFSTVVSRAEHLRRLLWGLNLSLASYYNLNLECFPKFHVLKLSPQFDPTGRRWTH